MAVPDYLIDQEEDYIKARGYTFRDFSAEQVLHALELETINKRVAEANPMYNDMVEYRYNNQSYKKVKSTSIAGGYIWKGK